MTRRLFGHKDVGLTQYTISYKIIFVRGCNRQVQIKTINDMSYTIAGIKSHLKACDITPENGIVVCSGVLAAHKLRPAADIDVVVTPEKFDELDKTGLFELSYFPDGAPCLTLGSIEIFIKWDQHDGINPNFDDLYKDSEIINGIRILKLERVKRWKERKRRSKDANDIKLIEAKLALVTES